MLAGGFTQESSSGKVAAHRFAGSMRHPQSIRVCCVPWRVSDLAESVAKALALAALELSVVTNEAGAPWDGRARADRQPVPRT